MVNCAVSYCKRRSRTSNLREHGISYHIFPKDPTLREKWTKFCGHHASWVPTRTSVICSVHFSLDSFEVRSNDRRILVNGAIPTLECYQPTTINDSLHKSLLLHTNLSYSKKENHAFITIKYINESNDTANNKIHNKDIYVFNVNIEPEYDTNDEKVDKYDFDNGSQDLDDGEDENKCELMIYEEITVKKEPILELNDEMCLILDLTPDEIVEDVQNVQPTKKAKQKFTKKEEKEKRVDRRFRTPKDIENEFEIENFRTEEEQRVEFEKRRLTTNYLESKFTCEMCLKGFREQKLLILHMKKHDESSGDFLCKICLIRVSTPKRYRTHKNGNHLAKYTCKRCDFFTYSISQARYHHSWHLGVEHNCPHCGASFRKYTTFMGHVRLVHPSQYICGTCAHSFVNEHGLNHHRKVSHKNQEVNSESSEKTRCADCDVDFDSYKIYVKHLMLSPKHVDTAKTIIACRECGEEFENKLLLDKHKHKEDLSLEERKQKLKCSQCNSQFFHQSGLYHHFVREHPGIPYKVSRRNNVCLCEQCGKTFNCRSKLLDHKRLHSGERPYICDMCQKSFRTSLHLNKHKVCHIGSKDHVCQVCLKAYSSASNLFKHKRIHDRVKLFKCDVCAKAFVDSSNLRQHIQGVHYNIRRNRRR